MSNLVQHAKTEIRALGLDDGDPENQAMYFHIMHMVKEFSKEGHSGFSASYAANILDKLFRFKPLCALTGADEEWTEIDPDQFDPAFQNKRCSHVFKGRDGQAYDMDGKVFREPSGACYTSSESRVFIEFPYTPKTEYVDVEEPEQDERS